MTSSIGQQDATRNQSALYESSRYGTIFEGLIRTSLQKFNPEHQLIEGEYYSLQTLRKVLTSFTHQERHCQVVHDPGYVPALVSSLNELGENEVMYNYLRIIKANSLAIQFLNVWSLANLSDSEIEEI